jgi:RimJ/RimL family protein N-acetyltransferase
MSTRDALAIVAWRYDGEHAVYDIRDSQRESAVAYMIDPRNGFFAAHDGEELVGFCSIGADGRVPGGSYDEQATDFGLGMRPDLVGKGGGSAFLGAVVDHVASQVGGGDLRVTVAAWNARALAMMRKAGFVQRASFDRPGGGSFRVLVRTGEEEGRHAGDHGDRRVGD